MALFRLLALVLAALQPAAAQQPARGELGPKAALSAEAAEEPRSGMVKLMDRVLADPSDEAARAELRTAVGLAVEKERRAAAAERQALVAGTVRDRAKILAMRAAKEKRFGAWKKDFSRACRLASGADTVKEAVAAYERLLETFPVYSDNRADLLESGIKIRKIFYDVIKKAYPYLVAGRSSIDERTLAALQFSRAAARQEFGDAPDSLAADKELKKAERFRRLERELAVQHENVKNAMDLYEKKRYAPSLKYFDEVILFDRNNEEALFYWALAKKRAAVTEDER